MSSSVVTSGPRVDKMIDLHPSAGTYVECRSSEHVNSPANCCEVDPGLGGGAAARGLPSPVVEAARCCDPRSYCVSIRERVAPSRVSTTLLAYLALTKPRVIELLLVTAIPAMLLADRGTREPAADPQHADRRDAGRRWRQHAELRGRRRHRQDDEADRAPTAGAGCRADPARAGVRAGVECRLVLLVVVDNEPAVGAAGGGHDRVLRVRLHAVAQAPHLAERGLGRGGRLHAGDDRAGRPSPARSAGRRW